jgi:hypothetical protein
MKASPEYYNLMHLDTSSYPLDAVKDVITSAASKAIDIIKSSKRYLGYDHSLASNFRTGEALNSKQFAETYISIGIKADAKGEILNYNINGSYISGALNDIVGLTIDSANGQRALVLSHKNVSETGYTARKASLNNRDTFLHADPNYSCNTRNLVRITIEDKNSLVRFNNRYYRMSPFGVEKKMIATDDFLIGQTIYLRSPITCASHAAGQGICYRCYGDLAYTNADINVGVIAAEFLTSKWTQTRLSSKHLLEAIVQTIHWCDDFCNQFRPDFCKCRW